MTAFWISAVAAYAFTQNVFVIYCGILFSMGASTMLSTTVNLTPAMLGCCISLYLLKCRCKQPDAEAI